MANPTLDAISSNSAGSGTSLSWSHTFSGINRHASIFVMRYDTSITSSSTVTVDGVSASLVTYTSLGANERIECWSLVAPHSGTVTITVTRSPSTGAIAGHCISHTGVHQSSPNEATESATHDATGGAPVDASLSITTVHDNAAIVLGLLCGDGTITALSGVTDDSHTSAANDEYTGHTDNIHPAGATTVGWTNVNNGASDTFWLLIATALRPAPDTGTLSGTIGAATVGLSATFAPGTKTGTLTATTKGATADLAGTFASGTKTGVLGAAIAPATTGYVVTFTKPTYAGVLGTTTTAATSSWAAVFAQNLSTGALATTAAPATTSYVATFSPGTKTGDLVATAAPAATAYVATFVKPTYSGDLAATIVPVSMALVGTVVNPTVTGTLAPTAKAATSSWVATFAVNTYTGVLGATAGHATTTYVATFTNPTFTGVLALVAPAVKFYKEIFNDTFSTDTTANYTFIHGTGTVTGGFLTTSSNPFLAIHNTANASGIGEVTGVAKVTVLGESFDVIASWIDENNCLVGRVTINGASSSFIFFKRESGVETQIGTTYTFTGSLNTNYTVVISWNGSWTTATLDDAMRAGGVFSGQGTKVGIGALPDGNTVSFDNLSFSEPFFSGTCTKFGFWTCCPTVCPIVPIDSFLTDSIGNYSQVSGTWAVTTASGGFISTADNSALIVANASGSTGHGIVGALTALSGGYSTAAYLGLVGAYVDANNYIGLQIGPGYPATLFERVGGVNTILTYKHVDISLEFGVRLLLCWNGTYAIAVVDGTYVIVAACTRTGNKGGMLANAAGGLAIFDDFFYSHHISDSVSCPSCSGESGAGYPVGHPPTGTDFLGSTCGACVAPMPKHIMVVLSGFSNDPGDTIGNPCTGVFGYDPSTINGTYVVEIDSGTCSGSLDIGPFCCHQNPGVTNPCRNINLMTISYSVVGADTKIDLSIGGDLCTHFIWSKTFTGHPRCLEDMSIPSTTGAGSGEPGGISTCDISYDGSAAQIFAVVV